MYVCIADGRSSGGGRATLLLLDRADDPLSPLIHEFTYQCLVEDLLGITVCGCPPVVFVFERVGM